MGLMDWLRGSKRSTDDDVDYDNNEAAAAITLFSDLQRQCIMTEQKALEIPAFNSSLNLLCGIICMLPIRLYKERKKDDGTTETEEVTDDVRVELLNGSTGDLLTARDTKNAALRDMMMHGAGYIYIQRRGTQCISLHYVKRDNISVLLGTDPIRKNAELSINGVKYYPWDFLIFARNTQDGVTGRGLIQEHKTVLSTAHELWLYEQTLALSGGNRKGFLSAESKLSDEAMDAVKHAWAELYNKRESAAMVLNSGLQFREASQSPMDMQLNQSRLTHAREVASIFGFSPELISGRATSDQIIGTVKTAIKPVIDTCTAAINNALLREDEKPSMYFAFDLDALMEADVLKRYQAYDIGLKAGFLTPSEIRYKEDMQPLPYNYIKLGLSDVLYDPTTGVIYTPNTNQAVMMQQQSAANAPLTTEEVEKDEVTNQDTT